MVLRIFKMIATSGFLSAFKCTKFRGGRGRKEIRGDKGKGREHA